MFEELYYWHPSKIRLHQDTIMLVQKLYRYVIPVSKHDEGNESYTVLGKYLGNSSYLVHSDVFDWYFSMLDAKTNCSLNKSNRLSQVVVDNVGRNRRRAPDNLVTIFANIDFDVNSGGVDNSLKRRKQVKKVGRKKAKFYAMQNLHASFLVRIRFAFLLMNKIWPRVYNEINTFLDRIIFFGRSAAIDFTNFKNYASVFLKGECINDTTDRIEIAEEYYMKECIYA